MKYYVQFSQLALGNPVITERINTIGGSPVWSRVGVGDYRGVLVGAFPNLKSIIFPFDTQGRLFLPIGNSTPADYYISAGRISNDEIYVNTFDAAYNPIEYSTAMGGSLFPLYLDVYP